MAIEAFIWQDERRQRQDVALAWRIAALMRTKRLPSLKDLLATRPAKPLRGKELQQRRQEFQEMNKAAAGLLQKLNRKD